MQAHYGALTAEKLKEAAEPTQRKPARESGSGQLFLVLLARAIAPMAGAKVSHSPIVTTIAVT
jgi:hypothetical protein